MVGDLARSLCIYVAIEMSAIFGVRHCGRVLKKVNVMCVL